MVKIEIHRKKIQSFSNSLSISTCAIRLPCERSIINSITYIGDTTMKFLMFMIPKLYQPETPAEEQAGEGFAPPAEAIEAMTKFNEELAKAGALISLDGLHPMSMGARVSFKGDNPTVTDGPFIEAKEVIGGYWVIDVDSKEEAVKWARKCPADQGDVIEIRQVFEVEDFPEDARKAADNPAVKEAIERGKAKQ